MSNKIDDKGLSSVEEAASFFLAQDKGQQLVPSEEFKGISLKGRSAKEMICDCCGDGDDCCGFN